MQIFIFLVLFVISYHSVSTSHISKIHFPIHLMYVNSNWVMLKRPVKEYGSPFWVGERETISPRKTLRLLNGGPSFYGGLRLPNAAQSK